MFPFSSYIFHLELKHQTCVGTKIYVLYQSLFTNTLLDHAYTKIHKQKNTE